MFLCYLRVCLHYNYCKQTVDVVYLLQIKCRSTLRISGLVPSAYWCGQAAVDIPFYYLILSFMTAILFSLHAGDLLASSNLTAVVRATYTLWPMSGIGQAYFAE